MLIETRKRRVAGSYTTATFAVPQRPLPDADRIYSTKIVITAQLDAAILADPTVEMDLWIEVTGDPAGLTGWQPFARCDRWRGGRLSRNGGPRLPRLGIASAGWANQVKYARVGWRQNATAFVALDAVLLDVTFDKRTSRSVAIDSGSAAQGEAAGDSLTVSVVVAAGTDLLVVGAVNYYGGGGTASTVSATHNGDAVAAYATTIFGLGNGERSTLLRRIAPDIGTFNVIITPTDTAINDEIATTILAFSGVDQTTPLDTAQTDAPDAVTETTLTVARDADDMVVSICGWYDQTVTVGGDLTQRVLNDNGAAFESIVLGTSVVDASIASTYSWAASENPGHIAVNINAAAGGAALSVNLAGRGGLAGAGGLAGQGGGLVA